MTSALQSADSTNDVSSAPNDTSVPTTWRDSIRLASVSEPFRDRVSEVLDGLPENVQSGLSRRGWRVRVAESVVDAAPELRGARPRGWPNGSTWENTDAVHLPDQRLLIVAETRRTKAGEIIASSRVEGAFRHELGHAFDMASGFVTFRSSYDEFINAVEADTRHLSAEDRSNFHYYLQASTAGRQELFAESFAIALGGGSDVTKQAAFESSFPRTIAYVRKVIQEFRP